MTSQSPWKIEAVLYDPKADEQLDWIDSNPGPAMRGWLASKFSPAIGGVRGRSMVMLMTTHLPSGATRQGRIMKDGRRYRVRYNGELLTLEAAVKMMKEELKRG